jgi:hypothetical protein
MTTCFEKGKRYRRNATARQTLAAEINVVQKILA